MKKDDYRTISIEETFRKLQSSPQGLITRDALRRIETFGKNEIPKKEKDSILTIFFNECKDPIILLLVVAIIASLVVGEFVDAIAILFIVLIDLILGTYQENKANTTIEALEKLVPEKVKVLRDGKEVLVDSIEITIGDLVFLESGDKISADARIIEATNFTIDESILTGESITVEKLHRVERAEEFLRGNGFNQFRVRIHGNLARIEILPDDFEKIISMRAEISACLKNFGFDYVTLDLQGFRSGSMNIFHE